MEGVAGIAPSSDRGSSGDDEGVPAEFGDEEFDSLFGSLDQDAGWSLFEHEDSDRG